MILSSIHSTGSERLLFVILFITRHTVRDEAIRNVKYPGAGSFFCLNAARSNVPLVLTEEERTYCMYTVLFTLSAYFGIFLFSS